MSETEYSETSSNSSEGTEEYSDSDNQDIIIEVEGNILAYQGKPLTDEEDIDDREDGNTDTDGLTHI